MRSCLMTLLPLLVAATAALAPSASAQVHATLPGTDEVRPTAVARVGDGSDPFQFGTNWSRKVIPASAFVGKGSSNTYSVWSADHYVYATAGSNFWAPLDLPPGSEVQQMCFVYYDLSATGGLYLTWTIHPLALDGVAPPPPRSWARATRASATLQATPAPA